LSEQSTQQAGAFVSLLILAIAVGATAFTGFAVLDQFAPLNTDPATVTDRFERESVCERGTAQTKLEVACTRYTVGGVTDDGEEWRLVSTSREVFDLVAADEAVTIGRSTMSGQVTRIDAANGAYRSWRSWATLIVGVVFVGLVGFTIFITPVTVSNMLVEYTPRNARRLAAATILTVSVVTLSVTTLASS